MKKLLLTTTIILSAGVTLLAQNSGLNIHRIPGTLPAPELNRAPQAKNIACANDTILYTVLKEAYLGTSSYGGIPLYIGGITEYSQAFTNTTSLTVKGISFYGGVVDAMNPNQTVTATATLYNVDANNMPTTVIATRLISMDTSFKYRTAMFTIPQTVTGNYAVAINNTSPTDTLVIFSNNAAVGTYDENLSYLNVALLGGWNTSSGLWATIGYTNNEAYEAIIAPVISYSIATDFTVTTSPVCLGQSIALTNNTSPAGIVENYMYTFNGFASHWGLVGSDSTYAWVMGDGTPLQWTHDVASYTYAAAGLDTVTLVTIGGLIHGCIDTKQVQVTVLGTAAAVYTYDATNAPTVVFTNTSTNATSYSWDFGDGSPIDNSPNPTHTYTSNGNFTVVLTATNSCNSSLNTQTVTISTVGIANNSLGSVSVFPNPSSTGMFEINTKINENSQLEVYNLIGKLLMKKDITSSKSVIDLSGFGMGTYTLKVITEQGILIRKLVVTK